MPFAALHAGRMRRMLTARRGQPLFMFDGDGGSGGTAPKPVPDANAVGEAKRKQGEAEARAAAAEARATQLEERLTALEGASDSELTKAIKRAEKAEGKVAELQGTIDANSKQGHVRKVAGEFKPHDVEALFKFVDLDAIKSEEDAKNALDSLKTTHNFLFQAEGAAPPVVPAAPAPFGAPVPAGGVPVTPGIPVGPNGEPDVQTGIGMGLLGALDRFRSQRGGGAGEQ